MKSRKQFNIGDEVTYTSAWLKQIQAPYEMYGLRGIVRAIKTIGKLDYISVEWVDIQPPYTKLVLPQYLCRIGSTETINSDLPVNL